MEQGVNEEKMNNRERTSSVTGVTAAQIRSSKSQKPANTGWAGLGGGGGVNETV